MNHTSCRVDTAGVNGYGQYCPVARGAEIFAERWTPIILRNILFGCHTFNAIAAGAPGLSRALLTRRLRELERVGVIAMHPKPGGHGWLYEPTSAGRALEPVIMELGLWAEQWTDVRREDSDPAVVIWSWAAVYLNTSGLPDRRLVTRFDFRRSGRSQRLWLLIDGGTAEVCAFDPGFGDDLVVVINDAVAFTRWHLGVASWTSLVKSGAVTISGPVNLRRLLSTSNSRPEVGKEMRAILRSRSAAV